MVRHSDALVLVWRIAELEAAHHHAAELEPVHYFLGLLKIVDVDPATLESLLEKGRDKASLIAEIAQLREAFDEAEIETTPLRRRLRKMLPAGEAGHSKNIRRSAASRAVFRTTEAFVGAGDVRPIDMLSILAEIRVPFATQLLEDLRLDSELLLEAATKIALSRSSGGEPDTRQELVARWDGIFQALKSKGWNVRWRRSLVGESLLWKVEAANARARHVVSSEDLLTALVELERVIAG